LHKFKKESFPSQELTWKDSQSFRIFKNELGFQFRVVYYFPCIFSFSRR